MAKGISLLNFIIDGNNGKALPIDTDGDEHTDDKALDDESIDSDDSIDSIDSNDSIDADGADSTEDSEGSEGSEGSEDSDDGGFLVDGDADPCSLADLLRDDGAGGGC